MSGLSERPDDDGTELRGAETRGAPLVTAAGLLVGIGAAVLAVALTGSDGGDVHTQATRSRPAAEATVAEDLEREAHLAGQAATHGAAPRDGATDPSGCALSGSADDILPGSRHMPRC